MDITTNIANGDNCRRRVPRPIIERVPVGWAHLSSFVCLIYADFSRGYLCLRARRSRFNI